MTAPAPADDLTAPPADSSPTEDVAAALALVQAFDTTRGLLTEQLTGLVAASAQRFTGWYDHVAITDWAARTAAQAESVLKVLAQTTDAYQARILSTATGRRVRPVGAVGVASLRSGDITHAGVYARAADAYRWQQSRLDAAARDLVTAAAPQPPTLVSPAAAAVQRAAAAADFDAQLAVREQSRKVMEAGHRQGIVTGWRRVIHPELSRHGTCGLCVAASHRLYGPKEPMPLHGKCNCVPMPVIDGRDPGATLNDADLQRIYREAGSTAAANLKDTRYQVNEHGELGPVLGRAGAPFRGPRTVKQDTSDGGRPKTAAQQREALERVRDSLGPALDKARALAGTDPKKWGSYLTQLEARLRDLDHQLTA